MPNIIGKTKNVASLYYQQSLCVSIIVVARKSLVFGRIAKISNDLDSIAEYSHQPNIQFILKQLQMMIKPAQGRKYTKYILALAVPLLCVSPAAYRLLRSPQILKLPQEKFIRDLMTASSQDNNLKTLLQSLQSV